MNDVVMTKISRHRFRRGEYENRGSGEIVGRRGKGVDKALGAPEKMMKNKTNGPGDCLVSEMLQELPVEAVYEITHWFGKRFRGECRAPAAWKILHLVFLKKSDAKFEEGIRSSGPSR